MKKISYKGRCEKRKVSKCKEICRIYNKNQSAYVDMLENDDEAVSFECNVPIKGAADDLYSTDFVIQKVDGSVSVRECVRRFNLSKPSYAKLLDVSRHYWLSRGVTDWGIVVEKEEHDESQ